MASLVPTSSIARKAPTPEQFLQSKRLMNILRITGAALAAITILGCLAALTIAYPHIMTPMYAIAIGIPTAVIPLISWAFGQFNQ